MKTRQVLADQLRARMAKRPDLDTQTKLSKAAGVTQSTVWRVLECQVGASVDVVESFGRAFGVPAIALLADQAQSQLLEAWSKLGEEDQQKVLSFMQVTISSRPSNMPPSKHWMDIQPVEAGLTAAAMREASHPLRGKAEDAKQTTAPKKPRQQRRSA